MNDQTNAHDLVWGAAAIAEVLNLSPRQVHYLLERQRLPARKVGNCWVASRSALLAFVLTPEAA